MDNLESRYRINVSKNGSYYFAVNEINESKAKLIFIDLSSKYPVENGFEVDVTFWDIGGSIIHWENLAGK